MASKTLIAWSDSTWNPVSGCTEVSPGCAHCYAKTFAEKWRGISGHYYEHGFDVQLRPQQLKKPLHWGPVYDGAAKGLRADRNHESKRSRRIFVNSMSDLFHEAIPDSYIDRVFAVMALTPWHTYQLLTKRIERAEAYLSDCEIHRLGSNRVSAAAGSISFWPNREEGFLYDGIWPLPNVLIGPTVENRHWAEVRLPVLARIKALGWRTMVSFEPLLQDVGDLTPWLTIGNRPWLSAHPEQPAIDWAIVGGESGNGRRPFDLAWARSIREQCAAAGVPWFMKQDGAFRPDAYEHLPDDLKVRQFPVMAVSR